MFGSDEGAQFFGLQRGRVFDFLRRGPFGQRSQVAAISIQCMRRHAAFDLQVREEVINHAAPSSITSAENVGAA
jgi:hypothetical protein